MREGRESKYEMIIKYKEFIITWFSDNFFL